MSEHVRSFLAAGTHQSKHETVDRDGQMAMYPLMYPVYDIALPIECLSSRAPYVIVQRS
jgi:hypothetical protein